MIATLGTRAGSARSGILAGEHRHNVRGRHMDRSSSPGDRVGQAQRTWPRTIAGSWPYSYLEQRMMISGRAPTSGEAPVAM